VRIFARLYRNQNPKIGRVGETKKAKFVELAARVDPTTDPVPMGHNYCPHRKFNYCPHRKVSWRATEIGIFGAFMSKLSVVLVYKVNILTMDM
jgi:hypothetical protein